MSQPAEVKSSGKEAANQASAPSGKGMLVSAEEQGLKLLSFLERRLSLSPAVFHKWIRTGQVRVNGSRAKPFDRLKESDAVRVPPFAFSLPKNQSSEQEKKPSPAPAQKNTTGGRKKIEVLSESNGILAVYKPFGLATHPGSGQDDSASEQLRKLYPDSPFAPTPIHRLDKSTSGLLLAAKTFEALRRGQELFKSHGDEGIRKEYLAWVDGAWPHDAEYTLRHYLAKKNVGGFERVVASNSPSEGKEAVLVARPVLRRQGKTLLLVRIFTGRTHQIRVQLASCGHPVTGDGKYGKGQASCMYLHALRVSFPDGSLFFAAPRWTGPFSVEKAELIAPIAGL